MNTTQKKMLRALIAFVAVMLLALVAYNLLSPRSDSIENQTSTSGSVAQKKTMAPNFSFSTEEGAMVELSDFQNKPTVLVFWASWCPYCKSELDGIEKIYDEFSDRVNFVALDCIGSNGETEDLGRATKSEHGWSFPIYFDSEAQGQASFGVRSYPATAIITSDGAISITQLGLLDHETLARLLRGMGA